MSRILQALIAITLLLLPSVALSAGGTQSPLTETGSGRERQWTTYDWNAASGNNGQSSFKISGGKKDGLLLHINAATPNDARFVREMDVEPDTAYRISCRVRSQNIGSSSRGAGISVLEIQDGSPDIKGDHDDWQLLEFYGKTGAEQHKLSVTVGIGGYGSLNSGSAWFKDLVVEKVAKVPAGVQIAALQDQPTPAPAPAGRSKSGGKVIAVIGCLGLLLAGLGILIRRRLGKKDEKEPERQHVTASVQTRVDRCDIAIMAAMTAVCLLISLYNLGNHTAPETGWQPASSGEMVTVELGLEVDLSRIYYHCGINELSGDGSRFTLAARNPDGTFVKLVSFAKEDVGIWKFAEVDVRTSAVRLTADTPGGRLNEIAFVEKGSQVPLTGLKIVENKVSATDRGKPEELLDEQAKFEYTPSFRNGFYFDEIYHARSAWEMLNQIEPYESTHPPLGKLLISSGIAIFGMNPFGWRVVGALFGVALVPLMYLFGLKLFRNRFYAFCAGFLMMVEFMRFAQSRVALIDVYGVFFILVMYYFILDLFPPKDERPSRSVNRTLLLAGAAFGIGAACKWIALYAGCGLSLLVILRTLADLRKGDYPAGSGATKFLLQRIAVCLVAFGVIPLLIYLLAYLPYMFLPGPGHGIADVLRLQAHMLNYHRQLHATHPFASPWWSWPLDLHPMWIYTGTGLPDGIASSIVTFGNPAIFWLGIPAVATSAFLAIRRRDAGMGVVLAALLFQYLPWVGINRLAFIYHFFSSVPFVILCLVATIRSIENCCPRFRAVTWGYLGIAAGLFAVFYPILSGMLVSQSYIDSLKWFPTWFF